MAEYQIKSGDSLTKLARQFGTTVAELAKMNNITDPDKIYIGDTLKFVDPRVKQLQSTVKQMLGQQQQQMDPSLSPAIPQNLLPPRGMTGPNTPLPGMGGSPIPSHQSEALQPSSPEALLGVPGLVKGGLGLAAGGLAGMAKMAPQMAKAGRIPPPSGYSNVVPMGSNSAFNSSMVKAMMGNRSPLQQASMRSGLSGGTMKMNPQRMENELAKQAMARDPRHFIGKGGGGADAEMLQAIEQMIARNRMGG